MEGFLHCANLPEKEELVKKYGELLARKGLSEESQLGHLTETQLIDYGVVELHAAAIAEAAHKFRNKVEEPKSKKARMLRDFYASGCIQQEEDCYFINPKNEKLLQSIDHGFYILLQGMPGSGKTTSVLHAIKYQLPRYCALYVSLRSLDYGDPQTFWMTFSRRFLLHNQQKIRTEEVTALTNAEGFQRLFQRQELFEGGKRVVLFVDEFDCLLYGQENVRKSFLDTLRYLRENRKTYCLHSVVGIGPPTVVNAVKLSSINFGEFISSPNFSLEETKSLFQQYCSDYGTEIAMETIEDIFERTRGHPGHTCTCGKEIQESLLRGHSKLEYKDWLQYALFSLPTEVSFRWRIGSQLQQRLDKESQELLLNFLAVEDHRIRLNVEDLQIAIDLSAVGVLAGDPSTNEFWIPSPLVQSIICSTLSFVGQPLPVPPPILQGTWHKLDWTEAHVVTSPDDKEGKL